MPKIRVNGANLYYEDTGGQGKETIVFSHGVLFNCHQFDAQVAALSERYRCIAYDHRGQGQSEVTKDGYDMETTELANYNSGSHEISPHINSCDFLL